METNLTPQEIALVTAKKNLTVTRNSLRDQNTQFALYVDPDGNKSSGSAGLMISINSRIKKFLDPDKPNLTVAECELLIVLCNQLKRIMEETEANQRPRAEGKKRIGETITKFGEVIRMVA